MLARVNSRTTHSRTRHAHRHDVSSCARVVGSLIACLALIEKKTRGLISFPPLPPFVYISLSFCLSFACYHLSFNYNNTGVARILARGWLPGNGHVVITSNRYLVMGHLCTPSLTSLSISFTSDGSLRAHPHFYQSSPYPATTRCACAAQPTAQLCLSAWCCG